MSLQARLVQIKEGAKERIPEDVRALMHRANEELRQSHIMTRALTVRDRLPAFTLPDVTEKEVSSADLLAQGPLVLTFYRGSW